ncbi:MAG: hypothetical protein FWF45_06355 [Coriobacteriia bacterium]|nr:hypothetical protein [Coriobacteriia bacterium]
MPCHCTDISRVKSDIATLTSIQSKQAQLDSVDSSQTSLCKQLSGQLSKAVTPANLSSLTNHAAKFNDSQKSKHLFMKTLVTGEINSLRQTLTLLQDADKAYHQAQQQQRANG